jgi:hypothetical protein
MNAGYAHCGVAIAAESSSVRAAGHPTGSSRRQSWRQRCCSGAFSAPPFPRSLASFMPPRLLARSQLRRAQPNEDELAIVLRGDLAAILSPRWQANRARQTSRVGADGRAPQRSCPRRGRRQRIRPASRQSQRCPRPTPKPNAIADRTRSRGSLALLQCGSGSFLVERQAL